MSKIKEIEMFKVIVVDERIYENLVSLFKEIKQEAIEEVEELQKRINSLIADNLILKSKLFNMEKDDR